MAIPSKQIGWSNESNLLWDISKQLEQLTGVTSKIGSPIPVTKDEIDILIGLNKLTPGATYAISGVDVPLYGGTTIILQAETTNRLSISGHGIFYNPKYDNSAPFSGYGIWNNNMNVILSNVSGQFISGDPVTADNGATGIYLANRLIQRVSGEWTTATSITDDNTLATADFGLNDYSIDAFDVTSGTFEMGEYMYSNTSVQMYYYGQNHILVYEGITSVADVLNSTSVTGSNSGATADISISSREPTYVIGDTVIWGGKKWVSITGQVGTAIDRYTLDSEWEVVPYNSVDYNVVVDEIMYDYEHDMIIARKDDLDNEVRGNYQIFTQLDNYTYDDGLSNPIKDFQWGNGAVWYPTTGNYTGVIGNKVYDAYLDCLNFKGSMIWYNNFSQRSRWYNNTFNPSRYSCYIRFNNVSSDSGISNNVFCTYWNISENDIKNSFIEQNICTQLAIINNDLVNNGNIYNNVGAGIISDNSLNYSNISLNKTLSDLSYVYISNNSLLGSSISENVFTNVVGSASISNNTLVGIGYGIISNTLGDYCSIEQNYLQGGGQISYNTLIDNGYIQQNNLSGNSTINSNTLISNYCNINQNSLKSGGIYNNSLNNSCNISSNVLEFGSIRFSTLDSNSDIKNNVFKSSSIDLSASGTLTSKTISYIDANSVTINANISAASIIYGTYSKQASNNSAGVAKLSYINASNVLTIVNVNA